MDFKELKSKTEKELKQFLGESRDKLRDLRFKDAKQMRLSTLKRFLSLDRFDLHLELHRLDCLASHKNLDAYDFCKKQYEEFKALPPPPLKLVTGADLIQLGLSPGPEFSQIIRQVEDAILEGKFATKGEAIDYVKNEILNKTQS